MFNRKFSSNIRRRKRMMISIIILLVVFLSVGYAAFTTDLSIGGTLNVSKYDHTLYGVLEKAVSQGYAREYTGNHQDSMAGVGTEKIYHWYAPNTTAGNTLANDKNNVIFADHCWQMIRTTDTGGVKMIYNGEVKNDQCLNNRGRHVGYSNKTTTSLSTTYYYGTDYTYDKTNSIFSLAGTITTGTIQTGQYTCRQTTSTGTCSILYLVDTVSSGTTYDALSLNANSYFCVFGSLPYNKPYSTAAAAGYMYNNPYMHNHIMLYQKEIMNASLTLSTDYYYANSYDYGITNTNKYTLTDPYQISSTSDYPQLVGKYTFRNTSSTYSDSSIYYIVAVNDSTMYYIRLEAGNNLAYYNSSYTYGDSYTDNGNGTYTINNPTTINRTDYYSNSSVLKNKKYVCKNTTNNTCSQLWCTTGTGNVSYFNYITSDSKYKYAKNFTYNQTTGKYTLGNDAVTMWDAVNSDYDTNLSTHHYTCYDTTGVCSTISYVFDKNGSSDYYYIDLSNGKSIENAIEEMIYSDDVNMINSTIKMGIDAWYKKYMTNYTSYLEDTIYCNDRHIVDLGGWNSNGGNVAEDLLFTNNDSIGDLSCTNTTDKFSLSNVKAQLTYPVGLLTIPEVSLLNNSSVMHSTSDQWWLMSPSSVSLFGASGHAVGSNSRSRSGYDLKYGVRPAISLKPGTEYVSGNGSIADPYVVE